MKFLYGLHSVFSTKSAWAGYVGCTGVQLKTDGSVSAVKFRMWEYVKIHQPDRIGRAVPGAEASKTPFEFLDFGVAA